MKHFTLLLISAFLFSSGFVSAQSKRFTGNNKTREVQTGTKNPASKLIKDTKLTITANSETGKWLPRTEEIYESDMEGGWLKYLTLTNEYDANGNNTSILEDSEEGQRKTIIGYDAYNNKIQVTSQILQNEEWVNSEKTEYTYDNVVTNYPTHRSSYQWNPETKEWQLSYSHRKNITRNKNGYVTRISVMLEFEGEYVEIERTDITYINNDLPATTWTFSQADESLVLHEFTRYEKIKWEHSDGQILASNEQFMTGNNRMKKADIYDEGIKTATFTATYKDGKRDFDCLIKSVSSVDEIQQKLTELDTNGSYKEELIKRLDKNQDGVIENYTNYMVATFDDHKNLVSEEFFEIMDEVTEQTDGNKMIYTYGPHGEKTETINQMWDIEALEYLDIEKIVASDFIETGSAIGSTQTGNGALTLYATPDKLSFEMEGMNRYNIYSAAGATVTSGIVQNSKESISIAQLPAGLYLLIASNDKEIAKAKFIKR